MEDAIEESCGEEDHLPTNRPIIGILAVEYFPSKTEGGSYGTYIAASYVKMVEASGARVVPIMTGQDILYYEKIVDSLNGILLPGGGVDLWDYGGYGEASKTLYELVLEANRDGNHFPMYGVCLGLEALVIASANMSKDVLTKVKGVGNTPLPLNFLQNLEDSDLYSSVPKELITVLRTKNVTSNHHSKSFTLESLKKHQLENTWKPLSTNIDDEGVIFVSSMEHIKFPQIFATQFHPEKIVFEWSLKIKDPHSMEAIVCNRHFYDHLAQHARRNQNRMCVKVSQQEEEEMLRQNLIYNYSPEFTSLTENFEQMYKFNPSQVAGIVDRMMRTKRVEVVG